MKYRKGKSPTTKQETLVLMESCSDSDEAVAMVMQNCRSTFELCLGVFLIEAYLPYADIAWKRGDL